MRRLYKILTRFLNTDEMKKLQILTVSCLTIVTKMILNTFLKLHLVAFATLLFVSFYLKSLPGWMGP